MAVSRSRRRRRSVAVGCVFAALVLPLVATVAVGQEATPPPMVFSMRLEGYAVEVNTFSTATAVTPRSAYSFAKLNSVLDLDGDRGLDMEARGANDQYAGFEGAVIFAGATPTDGNNLPGYAQAFYPDFEGFSTVSEKCATNQTEAKESPECRDQPGPYALARVVPDQARPVAEGIGRNQGDDARGDARSRSFIEPQPDGSVRGIQSNRGSDQGIPGTPITVDSYLAEQTVVTTVGSATTEIRCDGEVSVAGQPVNDNRQLQQALAPLTIGSDLRVLFEPATEPVVDQLSGGAITAGCRGPKITVFTDAQGGTGITYTFGSTFAATGITEDASLGGGDDAGFAPIGTPPGPPDLGVPSPSDSGIGTDGIGSSGSSPAGGPAPEAPSVEPPQADPDEEVAGGPGELVRRSVDSMPIGLWTGAAAALLPLGVWLLLGVTGSLARGLPSLRLPPFHD